MKSISIFFFLVMMLFCATNKSTNAQENKTPQQIKETQANYDGLIADLKNLASSAQKHYKKSIKLGGGGKSFSGWFIPEAIDTTGNGTFTAKVAKSEVTIVGFGRVIGHDGKNKIRVTLIVGPDKIVSTTINN